jgi:hypothetical protein
MKKLLEKDIQRQVCEYLALKKHFFWRQNTTPIYDPTRKTFRAMPKYSMKGVPDIIVLTDGGFSVFLEIKRKGQRLRPDQVSFKERCEKIGCEYYTITDVSQLKDIGL